MRGLCDLYAAALDASTRTALCATRVAQMTNTYDDIDTVTCLLAEREKDLELAARIGQSLLEDNQELRLRNEFLEEQLASTSEQVTQLKHELNYKTALLHTITEHDSESTGLSRHSSEKYGTLKHLQKLIKKLEEENLALKSEQSHLRGMTDGLEIKEKGIVDDCMKQLAQATSEIEKLTEQLAEKQDQCCRQQEELIELQTMYRCLHINNSQATTTNESLLAAIHDAKEAQAKLCQEFADLQERYAEVLAMLQEAKEELRKLRSQSNLCGFAAGELTSLGYESQQESLLSELEAISDSETGISPLINRSFSRLQNTCEQLTKAVCSSKNMHSIATDTSDDLTPPHSPKSFANPPQPESPVTAGPCRSHTGSSESIVDCVEADLGVPGLPGSKDLKAAMSRLQIRREIEMNFAHFRNTKLQANNGCEFENTGAVENGAQCSPRRSLGTGEYLRGPRVQIVKAITGSSLLKNWSNLASADLNDLFREVPGVAVRAELPIYSGTQSNAAALMSQRASTSCNGLIKAQAAKLCTSSVAPFFDPSCRIKSASPSSSLVSSASQLTDGCSDTRGSGNSSKLFSSTVSVQKQPSVVSRVTGESDSDSVCSSKSAEESLQSTAKHLGLSNIVDSKPNLSPLCARRGVLQRTDLTGGIKASIKNPEDLMHLVVKHTPKEAVEELRKAPRNKRETSSENSIFRI